MPAIDNKTHTLLQGLSDFWTRFYADIDELNALYRGTEVLIAQTYLDMLSSFLNISIVETPLFNTELFKLLALREDQTSFDEGSNPSNDRHRYDLPDNLVSAHILQNKVIDPTASLEQDAGYEIDDAELELRFTTDPTGYPGRIVATVTDGNLLAFGISGDLKRFYVTSGSPFAKAKPGHWLKVQNSGSGNNATYRVARLVDDQALIIQPLTSTTLTTPDTNSGSLKGELIDSDFTPEVGFAHRVVAVDAGGSFDDPTTRQTTEIESWYPASPVGLGVRKGDILRILDADAVPSVPLDFNVALVRHEKLYLSTDTPAEFDASNVTSYAVLREGADPDITGELQTFAQVGTPKTGTLGSFLAGASGTPAQVGEEVIFETTSTLLVSTDRQRFVTVTGSGDVTWTGSLAIDGVLTRTAGMQNVIVRSAAGGSVTISGSAAVPSNNGTYIIESIADDNTIKLVGQVFVAEPGLSIKVEGVTNDGTYRIKKFLNDHQVVLDLQASFDDANNGALSWTIHDGYQAGLTKTRIQRTTLELRAGLGHSYVGGRRAPIEDTDFTVNYETGVVLQVGRHAGTWGVVPQAYFNYSWLTEVLVVATGAGAGVLDSTDILVSLNETAMWAPDAQVDRFNLYNNYGYLIDRFEASSETYREFIRGVFQLYILGPTLERLESALNVIGGFPVIRDDGEVLTGYDTSDPDFIVVTTLRLNGDVATYQFPAALTMRSDLALSASIDTLAFESFEPLSLAFQTSDHVQDPSWWTDIVIPLELMPNQSIARRRTISALIENTIGAWDGPRIGDPGFFIGADDEGNVPSFISTAPALRRKMSNVVMERFLRWNVFFVRFDDTVFGLLDTDFTEDLLELILVAKPGYRYMFIEPFSSFEDAMLLTEDDLEITAVIPLADETMALGEDTLTLQSFSWNIGDVWRANTPTVGQALVVADGIGVPNGGVAINLGAQNLISKMLWIGGTAYARVQEDVDYDLDYKTGMLTPKTVWPAGTYTIDFRNLTLTAAGSADPSLGDTPYTIGGLDPAKVRNRREHLFNCDITTVGTTKRLTCSGTGFVAALHEDEAIQVHNPPAARGLRRILRVVSPTEVVLYADGVSNAAGVEWSFQSEEPLDGEFVEVSGAMTFKSASALFQGRHLERYVRVKDAANGANNKRHKIIGVLSMSQVVVETGPVAETDLHWRLEGTQRHMDLVERPLQITVT